MADREYVGVVGREPIPHAKPGSCSSVVGSFVASYNMERLMGSPLGIGAMSSERQVIVEALSRRVPIRITSRI